MTELRGCIVWYKEKPCPIGWVEYLKEQDIQRIHSCILSNDHSENHKCSCGKNYIPKDKGV